MLLHSVTDSLESLAFVADEVDLCTRIQLRKRDRQRTEDRGMARPLSYFTVVLLFFAISPGATGSPWSLRQFLDRLRSREDQRTLTELKALREAIELNERGNQDSTCSSGHFLCSSERKCIYAEWVCDGHNDCQDGSDETSCQKLKDCRNAEFRCHRSGRCLPLVWVCDGEKDCNDGSDELQCHSTQHPPQRGCPSGFNYVESLRQCYSTTSEVLVNQREASTICSQLHPRAHLPAIVNKEQNELIRQLILNENPENCPIGIWTSGKRGHSFRPFTWQLSWKDDQRSTNSPENTTTTFAQGQGSTTFAQGSSTSSLTNSYPINYTDWADSRSPRPGFGRRQNCIFIDRTNSLRWNQRPCDDLLCFICQIDLQ